MDMVLAALVFAAGVQSATEAAGESQGGHCPGGMEALPGFSLQLDNDYFARPDHDEDYTGAFALTAYELPESWRGIGGGLLRGVDWLVGFREPRCDTANASEFGVVMFTPDRIKDPLPQYGDRPFASLAYLAHSHGWMDPDGGMRQSTLTLGLLGTEAGRYL